MTDQALDWFDLYSRNHAIYPGVDSPVPADGYVFDTNLEAVMTEIALATENPDSFDEATVEAWKDERGCGYYFRFKDEDGDTYYED